MKTIKVTYKVVLPPVPDILFVEGTKETVPIEAVTEDSLRVIGQEWTNELIEKARKKSGAGLKKEKASKPKGKSNKPKNKYIHSDYKGVRGTASGKWEAKYYDKKKKKVIYIGIFDAELVAAAKVQEKMGNKKEARRLLNEYEEGDSLSVPKVNTGMQPGDFMG